MADGVTSVSASAPVAARICSGDLGFGLIGFEHVDRKGPAQRKGASLPAERLQVGPDEPGGPPGQAGQQLVAPRPRWPLAAASESGP